VTDLPRKAADILNVVLEVVGRLPGPVGAQLGQEA